MSYSNGTATHYVNPNVGPIPGTNTNPEGIPAVLNINNLGYPVTTRSFTMRQFAVIAWGDQWGQPDHDIYEFPNREFDSTDQYTTGVYDRGITSTDGLLIHTPHRDATAYIMICKNNQVSGRLLIRE